MLSLFLLKRDVSRDGKPKYNTTHSFIIAAMNEVEARIFASTSRRDKFDGGDESSTVWYAPTTSCKRIGIAADEVTAGVILRDFKEG